jgi:hypothetical protein
VTGEGVTGEGVTGPGVTGPGVTGRAAPGRAVTGRAVTGRAVTGRAAPGLATARPRLYIDVQHGLCNRLRALASAAVIAEAVGRQLVVIWRPDAHCRARAGDLLRLPWPVIEDGAAEVMRARSVREWNYMEVEPGAKFDEPVLAETAAPAGDVYVRSAYVLVSPHRSGPAEARVLRALRPAEAVLDLVQRVARPSAVAVHVRMATGPGFDHLAHEAPTNWPAARHRELTEWRQASAVDRFIAALDRLVAEGGAETIFAAADLAETYAALAGRYGARLRWLSRDLYDRSTLQLQYALADLILLTAAPLFLASSGSSFSDTAQRLARPGRKMRRSGLDF